MQTSSISLIILFIFVQAYTPLPLSQSSSNNYISIQQHIIQSDILIECSFLDVGQCSSSKSLSTEPAANHEISNVVLNQFCSYINGGNSVALTGQINNPLGKTINPEIKDHHELVSDPLDNGNSLIPSFCSVKSAMQYLGQNIDDDDVQKINPNKEDLFCYMIGFSNYNFHFEITIFKLNQSVKL